MTDVLKNKLVITRKPHRCYGCDRMIPKGAEMTLQEGVNAGTWYRIYWCAVCVEVIFVKHDDYDEEMLPGWVKEDDIWEETRARMEGVE